MMKKILLYIGIAIAAIGCVKDDIVEIAPSSRAIEFSATLVTEGVETRLSSTNDCAWAVRDDIGLFTNKSSDSKNMLFSIVSDDSNDSDKMNLATLGLMEGGASLYADTMRTYYAYYPYSEDYDTTSIISVDCTQDYSDLLLWATKADTTTASSAVDLIFKHMRPKVTFNLTAGGKDVTSLQGATATLQGANATATFDIEGDGTFTDLAKGDIDLTISDGKITGYMLPTATVKDSVTLWVFVGSDIFCYPITTASWDSGSSYEYSLVVGDELPVVDYSSTADVNALLGLDANNTDLCLSNCYMVDPAIYGGTIIPIYSRIDTFWGNNGYENGSSLEKESNLWISNDACTIEPLWNDFGLDEADYDSQITFEKVTGTDGNHAMKIKFAAGFSYRGNMVVAVRMYGTILWSWHIWITDYNPYTKENGTTYDIVSGSKTLTWMDRNVGARDTEYSSTGDGVLYYQWGRKDPIRANNIVTQAADATRTIADVVKSPTYFYLGVDGVNDWCGSTTVGDQDRDHHWRDAKLKSESAGTDYDTAKSIYDPSPLGFMVPCSTETSTNETPFVFISGSGASYAAGYSWDTNGVKGPNDIFFFLAYGYLGYTSGTVLDFGSYAYSWASMPSTTDGTGYCLNASYSSPGTSSTSTCASGLPVRSIKEF